MSKTVDPPHEAIEALRATGRTVTPAEDRPGLYSVDHGPPMTTGDVLALAIRLRLMDGSGALQ